jgi:hypothetical protein|tara:strand:- start:288 stop:644 length:357 start_codon:yes stop_codon:yes gene_type:complete
MNDLELLRHLKKHDAVCVDEVTHYAGQVMPTLRILDSSGKIVCLPSGIHINHVVCVLERHGLLIEKGLTPEAQENSDKTNKMFSAPNLQNFDVSHLHEQLADVSNFCQRRQIQPSRHS